MSNTSATGGYLAPAGSPAPLEGTSFQDFLQALVVGITGLPGNKVFPRWQQEPPNLPPISADWAAIGITRTVRDFNANIVHDPSGNGADELQRNESVEILTSFYGPNADSFCDILSDGLQIDQNREVLFLNAMGLVATGDSITVPSIVKERWQYRVDLPMTIRRQVRRSYPILSLLSASGTIDNERDEVQFSVTEP